MTKILTNAMVSQTLIDESNHFERMYIYTRDLYLAERRKLSAAKGQITKLRKRLTAKDRS
ncbi:MAG: hypothetical protein EPN62_05710 [Candidimonas sp.]|nr:MAG: hypothetical protein EPN77_16765 [Candidimonas sp.]TAM24803.1 MAG: hypothetical protein EPN62_05710 [Candidimonas sp.]